jgi:hypothetical protein
VVVALQDCLGSVGAICVGSDGDLGDLGHAIVVCGTSAAGFLTSSPVASSTSGTCAVDALVSGDICRAALDRCRCGAHVVWSRIARI